VILLWLQGDPVVILDYLWWSLLKDTFLDSQVKFLQVANILSVKASTGLDSMTCTESELVASTLKR